MGYLPHRISRRRCAAEVDRAIASQARGLPFWEAAPAKVLLSTARRSYLRFAVGRIEPATQRRLGIFRAAGRLEQSGDIAGEELRRLRASLLWFNRNLKVPRVPASAAFWFKSDAAACMQRVWHVVWLLKANDQVVWMMRAEQLGQVVYEDAHQVAAVASSTRPRRCRPV